MIFQRNHLPRLSGSSLIFFLIGLFVLQACGSSKSSRSRRVTNKPAIERKQDQIRRERSKIDTVEWTVREERTPITDELPLKGRALPPSEMKPRYNVDMIIPFSADGFKTATTSMEISAFQNRFVNFYNGVYLAAQDLSKKGINIDLDVHDSEYKEKTLQSIYFNGELRNSDLIIGPYKKENVKWLAQKIQSTETTMISPWISSTSIADDNPFYLQTKPGLIQHYKTMLRSALQEGEGKDVYLVVMEGDESKERYFTYVSNLLQLDPEKEHFKVLKLNTDTLTHGVAPFDTTIFHGQPACDLVFMVPYASGRDATFTYDFLRQIQIQAESCEYVIYGMYRWLDYQDEMFELMNAMPVKLTISNLVNAQSQSVKSFKRRYFNAYGAYPTEDAFEGYDLMMYVGESLKNYGNRFHFEGDKMKPYTGLQTVFDLQPELNKEGNRIDYFENQFIDLISIKDFQYQRSAN